MFEDCVAPDQTVQYMWPEQELHWSYRAEGSFSYFKTALFAHTFLELKTKRIPHSQSFAVLRANYASHIKLLNLSIGNSEQQYVLIIVLLLAYIYIYMS